MKRIGLIFTTIVLFTLALYTAYVHGIDYAQVSGFVSTQLISPSETAAGLSSFSSGYLGYFSGLLGGLTSIFDNSLLAGIIVLALLVELITLYPSVNIQLKQKKIHLFHKKLVDRFHKGELALSKTKRELDVLYSVNERIHSRGALLVVFQLAIFLLVLFGLYLTTQGPSSLLASFSSFNFSLFSAPVGVSLPILAGLAYLLHSLVKIHLKQKEDYISSKQTYVALGLAVLASAVVFYFASVFAVLLTVYFLSQITFSTMRYIIVEDNSKAWGKHAQRELIKLLRTSKLHKNKVEHWSRKFNHLPIVRHLNFHLLEEAMSMSLVLTIVLNSSSVYF